MRGCNTGAVVLNGRFRVTSSRNDDAYGGDIAMYQTLGFTRWPHYKLTLFALNVTPEGCNPESSYSINWGLP